MGTPVVEAWSAIESVLSPNDRAKLGRPASDAEVARLREALASQDLPLPDALAESLACHDGGWVRFPSGNVSWAPMSVSEIVEALDLARELKADWAEMEPDAKYPEEVAPTWWGARWIPIAASGGGDHLCIDLGPSPAGREGQIVRFFHDTVRGRGVEAPDYLTWLGRLATAR